jgi:hypothetical protein
VYRQTIAVRVGNFDEIHSYVIDLMLQTHLRRDSCEKLDVMDCLWYQIYYCMVDRRSPAFAPYIMKLIFATWEKKFQGKKRLEAAVLTPHLSKKFQIKSHKSPKIVGESSTAAPEGTSAGFGQGPIGHMGLGDPPSFDRSFDNLYEPSWVQRLKIKVKKTFCLQLDIQERLYEAHVNEKKSRRRQKQMLAHMQLPVSSGSEENITPKEEWISQHSQWDEDLEDTAPARHTQASSGMEDVDF